MYLGEYSQLGVSERIYHKLYRLSEARDKRLQNGKEDLLNSRVLKVSVRDYIEVSGDTICNVLSSTTRRSHCSHKNDIFYLLEWFLFSFSIIPSFMIHPLSKNLYRGLSTIHLFLRHIQVINEDDKLLTRSGPKDPFPPFLKLRVQHILCLVSASLS